MAQTLHSSTDIHDYGDGNCAFVYIDNVTATLHDRNMDDTRLCLANG